MIDLQVDPPFGETSPNRDPARRTVRQCLAQGVGKLQGVCGFLEIVDEQLACNAFGVGIGDEEVACVSIIEMALSRFSLRTVIQQFLKVRNGPWFTRAELDLHNEPVTIRELRTRFHSPGLVGR
ncbi:hypothetical protein D9M72_603790 [compost metagenome]